MRDRYDAIVIGAGHNSLVCAAHIQKKGWRTIVLEQAGAAGGAVKTLEITQPGFRHDWAAMNLSLFAASAFTKKYGNELARCGMEFVPVSDCFATVFPDGRWLGVSADMARTRSRIATFSQRDAERWQTLVAEFPEKAEFIFEILGNSMKMHGLSWTLLKAARKKGIAWAASLLRLMLASPRAWLEENFETPQVRAMLAAWGMHLDFAPDIAGGALFPYLEGMANQSFGMVIGKGGADTIIRALVEVLRGAGGELHTGARVERILVDGGRAKGVRLADGSEIGADKAVIANVAPANLIDSLLGGASGSAEFDATMRGFRHAPGTMMIHLAMDALPGWKAGEELAGFAYVHLAPSLDQMARTYQQASAGLLPDEPVVVVGQPTAIDPGRAPDGKHVLWIQVRMAPAIIEGDAAGEIDGRDWPSIKGPFADRVIGILERYAPGVRSLIVDQKIVAPIELEADNPNLVGGDQICGSHHLSQHFMFRPAYGLSAGDTPVRGLYLTGASVWPGAGTGAGSGFMLGKKLAGP